MSRNIVVFGGTGQQGSAFVRALGEHNSPITQFTIYLLSRRADVGSLADVAGVTVVRVASNYMNEPEAALAATGLEKGEVYGVFMVNGYMKEREEVAQGTAVVHAAADWGVKHFVYSSVSHDDRVLEKPDSFNPKRRIERAIKSTNMGWTMLRDTDFMDNWLPSQRWVLKAYRTMLLRKTFYHHPERKIVMVSTRDIGRGGALAFAESGTWMGAEMALAGDEMDIGEIQRVYREVMGEAISETWGVTAGLAKWLEPGLRELAHFYDNEGYDIHPSDTAKFLKTEDFRSFLERYKREHVAL